MARGVRKIAMTKGLYYPKKTAGLDTQVTIKPDQYVSFDVSEWIKGSTEEDKKKQITWMRQENNRKIILAQIKSTTGYSLLLPKKLCGPYAFYIEASLSGVRDYKNPSGIYVNGFCDPIIRKSNWRKEPKGENIKNKTPIKYGEPVYIWLSTEGLNGNTITIEVYNQAIGSDTYIDRYTNVKVTNGEVAFKIGNTKKWLSKVGWYVEGVEEFYIKAKIGSGDTYIKDHLGQDNHAVYLNIENEIIDKEIEVSENLTPTKVFKAEVNAVRHQPCKFDKVTVSIPTIKDGKTITKTLTAFEHGKTKMVDSDKTDEYINRNIHFKFNDYSIAPEAQEKLNNILGFLLEHKGTTITITGYACVIGKEDYNLKLSQKRSDTVKDFFVNGGLDKGRIVSTGRGEYNILNPDDYKNKNEEEYIDARRVDISFTFHGHIANTTILETIASSSEKLVTLDILGFDVADCYREKNKHKEAVIVKSFDKKKFEGSGSSIEFPIQSTLSSFNPAPLQYIVPKYNGLKAITGKKASSAAIYNVHLHSCRYYTLKNKPAIQIKAYPDIKWNFQLSFNYSNAMSYTHGNLPEYKRLKEPEDKENLTKEEKEAIKVQEIKRDRREAQSKATASGIETKKMQNSPEMLSKFGIKLEADWNDKKQHVEISKDFAEKIRGVIKAIVKYKEVADNVKNTIGGKAKGLKMRPPFMFEVASPSLNLNFEWYLEQGEGKHQAKVANVGVIRFKADPLIGASFTIDLLAVGSRMHPFVAAMVTGVDLALSALNGGMRFEAIFRGNLKLDIKALEFNSLSGRKAGSVDLGAELGLALLLEISFKVKYDTWFKEVDLELRAEAKGDAYFEAKAEVNSDEEGIFFKAGLGFSGLIFTFKAEVVVGGFKRNLKFGNEEDPFLKGDIGKPYKTYFT